MAIWEEFEVQCTDYLNHRFGQWAKFFHQGGSDSTVADILVETYSGKSFYMDAKHSPAQCGQFVLIPDLDSRKFEYSSQNVNRINCYAEMIMDYMNRDFDAFREAKTAGKDINMPNATEVFAGWIIQSYRDKGVEFFITNEYTIFPIEQFSDYFDVSAKYRVKRSGSGNVGKGRMESVIDYICSQDYAIPGFRADGDKLFVNSAYDLHERRFIFRGMEYMFSLRGEEYELRKLSNTYNANVIFSIRQKSVCGMSDEDFIYILREGI